MNDNSTNTHFQPEEKIAVIGAGEFGTAMASLAARNGHKVYLYCRDQNQCDSINNKHINSKHLTSFELSNNIVASTSINEILNNVNIIILTLPAQQVVPFCEQNKEKIDSKTLICNTAKGLYLHDKCLLSEGIMSVLGREQQYCVLSGPSFAHEILQQTPTAVVVASRYRYHAVTIQRILSTPTFMVYISQDVIGVELGGALKNPLAIGAGVLQGIGLGVNSLAAYVTRSSLELQLLCHAMGGEPQTISGLSGVGDLMLTAFGDRSRNRELGKCLAAGESLSALTLSRTVEGVPTASVAIHLADRCGLELPVFRAVAAFLEGHISVQTLAKNLLSQPGIPEMEIRFK